MTVFLFEEKINENKRINLSLKECFGIGKTSSNKIYFNLGFNISKNYKFKSNFIFLAKILDNVEQKIIYLNEFIVSAEKKKALEKSMKQIKESNCLRWKRHFQKLPVRGQHTRTNARTQKSKRGFRRGLPVAAKKKQ